MDILNIGKSNGDDALQAMYREGAAKGKTMGQLVTGDPGNGVKRLTAVNDHPANGGVHLDNGMVGVANGISHPDSKGLDGVDSSGNNGVDGNGHNGMDGKGNNGVDGNGHNGMDGKGNNGVDGNGHNGMDGKGNNGVDGKNRPDKGRAVLDPNNLAVDKCSPGNIAGHLLTNGTHDKNITTNAEHLEHDVQEQLVQPEYSPEQRATFLTRMFHLLIEEGVKKNMDISRYI